MFFVVFVILVTFSIPNVSAITIEEQKILDIENECKKECSWNDNTSTCLLALPTNKNNIRINSNREKTFATATQCPDDISQCSPPNLKSNKCINGKRIDCLDINNDTMGFVYPNSSSLNQICSELVESSNHYENYYTLPTTETTENSCVLYRTEPCIQSCVGATPTKNPGFNSKCLPTPSCPT